MEEAKKSQGGERWPTEIISPEGGSLRSWHRGKSGSMTKGIEGVGWDGLEPYAALPI